MGTERGLGRRLAGGGRRKGEIGGVERVRGHVGIGAADGRRGSATAWR